MLVKIAFTWLPAVVSAATHTSEISATSSAYSIRSCPSSSRRKFINSEINFMVPPGELPAYFVWLLSVPLARSGRRQLARDVGEDRVHLTARGGQCCHAHERNQRDEQRVLDQVLSLFLANE